MTQATCRNCTHFHQHYTLDKQSCSAIDCGHCDCPRLRHRAASAAPCGRFAPRVDPPELPDRKDVVHYLTTEVLQYILNLELPPEIVP